ncbi:hypothetical protein [Methylobacterium sp. 1030]|uniref:hypothetical protein n=1 Tax=Methylobacterium sp. 1030 TaxID=3156404 RepID=UPI003390C466
MPTQADVLVPEIVVWLRENATTRDGWRFVIVPITTWVQHFRSDALGYPRAVTVKTEDIAFEVWFARPNDALAFRMRWG